MPGLVVGDAAAPVEIRHALGYDVAFALALKDAAGADKTLPAGATVDLIIAGLAPIPGVITAGQVRWDVQAATLTPLPDLAAVTVAYHESGYDGRWLAGYALRSDTARTLGVQGATAQVTTDGLTLVNVTVTAGIPGAPGEVTEAELSAGLATKVNSSTYTAGLALKLDAAEKGVGVAAIAKLDNGGAFLRPLRVPTLVVDQLWPNRNYDMEITWADGATLYARGWDKTVYKSVDTGENWTRRGHKVEINSTKWLKTSTGTLLAFNSGTPTTVWRSTDDGVTWVLVHTWPTLGSPRPMGSTGWAIDPVTNYIYSGEYQSVDTGISTITVYRSTDDGATWAAFHTFAGPSTASADKIRHVHGIQWDPFALRIVVMAGDSEPAAGLWQVNTAGTALEPLLLNRDIGALPGGSTEGARAIGLIPFADYIAWTGDATSNPYLMRVARTQLGQVTPTVERVYRLNSCGWFACRASVDGSRWVFSSSPEGAGEFAALDGSIHLYAVEDQGATVYEVGALANEIRTTAALSPVGQPLQGDVFWLQSHNVAKSGTWRCRLARGVTPMPSVHARPTVYGWVTVSTPTITLPVAPSSTIPAKVILGRDQTPSYTKRLHIFEAAVWDEADLYTRMKIRVVRKSDQSVLYESIQRSTRRQQQVNSGVPLATITGLTGGTEIEFQLVNVNTTATPTGTAAITYGWGPDVI